MKTRIVVSWLLLGLLSPLSGAAQDKREQGTYQEMREYLGELFQQKKYAEAAALLERVLDRFPDNVRANTYNLATMRVLTGEPEKAILALEEGLRRGVFYGLWDFEGAIMAPLKKHDRFQAFWKQNVARLEQVQSTTTMRVEVVTPSGYDPSKTYPLFVALHGGGEGVAEFKPNWRSPRLQTEFVTAYVQSSQVASMTGFHWQNEARTRRDLEAAYKEVLATYRVDTNRVLVGGFSSGGFASLIAAFHQFLPVQGFVSLCPEVPTSIADSDITAAAKRGLRGSLLTTEFDGRVDRQRALADRWNRLGLAGEIIVTPDTGHWYPKDFGQQLDRAIDRILAASREPRVAPPCGMIVAAVSPVTRQAPPRRPESGWVRKGSDHDGRTVRAPADAGRVAHGIQAGTPGAPDGRARAGIRPGQSRRPAPGAGLRLPPVRPAQSEVVPAARGG